jgi:hypothetical protein
MDNTGKTSSPSGKLIISKFTAAAIFGTLNTSFAVS